MGKSFHICNILGIPLKVHWSFGLMILFIIYIIYLSGLSLDASIGFLFFVLVMFLCVILHELSHSLVAKKYRINTIDIIISPIGGLARLTKIPEEPKKELFIAIAGPLVNLIIAILIGAYLHFIIGTNIIPDDLRNLELLGYSIDFMKFVVLMNFMLFIFNLVPAFPMDGGRVLRALLSFKMERVQATRVAMWIARIISFGFLLYSFYTNNITLGLIGVFVFIMSGKEYNYVRIIKKASTKISEIFRTNFTNIKTTDDYKFVIDIYKKGEEKNFIVFNEEEKLIGSLPEIFIKDAIKNINHLSFVSELMSPTIAYINTHETLRDVSDMMNQNGIAICAVKEDNKIIGVLDRNDIRKFMRE